MKVLVLGGHGQLGTECLSKMINAEDQLCRPIFGLGKDKLDITDYDSLEKQILELRPNIIINCASYTKVDKAEEDAQEAFDVNYLAVDCLARLAKQFDISLIHLSTNYVFNGIFRIDHEEYHRPDPQTAYGKSKFQGELAVTKSGCDHIILRTGWMYSNKGKNFPKTILNNFKISKNLKIVHDQFGSPTPVTMVADVIYKLIQQWDIHKEFGEYDSGIYHATTYGKTSWYDFAKLIIESRYPNQSNTLKQIPYEKYNNAYNDKCFHITPLHKLRDFNYLLHKLRDHSSSLFSL